MISNFRFLLLLTYLQASMNSKVTFNNLPEAIEELLSAIERIEGKLDYSGAYLKDLISIREASELLNLSVATIYGKVCRRAIPVYKKGKKLYFSRKKLEAWIEEGVQLSDTELREGISLREIKGR